MTILTIDQAFQNGNAELIEDALDQFNDKGVTDGRVFTEILRRVKSRESIENLRRITRNLGTSRFRKDPTRITIQ